VSGANAPAPADAVVVLDDETVAYEGAPADDLEVRTAESDAELAGIWRRYHLTQERPALDGAARVAVAFSQDGFCNDDQVSELVITTAGELVPQFRSGHRYCDLVLQNPKPATIHVLSLPRSLLSSRPYVIRDGVRTSRTFAVKGSAPLRSSSEGLPARSPSPPLPGSHPRRARLFCSAPDERKVAADLLGAPHERAGVWVRDDAAWFPMQETDRLPDGFIEPPTVELACDADACVRPLVIGRCEAPECPTWGFLAITERTLKATGPWPTDPGAWNRLMRELTADPWVAGVLPVPPEYPRQP
jgi:hypothetical protein